MKQNFLIKVSISQQLLTVNPQGRIIRKYEEGLVMPDGQNFREQGTGTSNLNFTLFIPRYFPTLKEANAYASSIIEGINQGGRDGLLYSA